MSQTISISLQSVQSLLIQMLFGDQVLGSATGFVASSPAGPVLITNRHVVTGRHQMTNAVLHAQGGLPDRLRIWHNHTSGLGNWVGQIEMLLDTSGAPLWKEHPQLGAGADIVALKLTQMNDIQLYPYDVATPEPSIAIGPTRTISIIGFPFGQTGGALLGIWTAGSIASEPNFDFNDLPCFLVDCRARPGQSGSPTIVFINGGMASMSDGSTVAFGGPVLNFLGVYSGRINEQSDLGIVWKARAVRELIASV